MSHTTREKDRLIARVRRIRGQLEGIERALAAEAPCAEVLRQVASVRGAMNGLTSQLFDAHLKAHVLEAATEPERAEGAEQLMGIVRTYLK
jgi:DNA-binding FrmR family transcriptional regulator